MVFGHLSVPLVLQVSLVPSPSVEAEVSLLTLLVEHAVVEHLGPEAEVSSLKVPASLVALVLLPLHLLVASLASLP